MVEKLHCDICDQTPANKVRLPYDRSPDGAGSMVTDIKFYDLCDKCELAVYKSAFTPKKNSGEIFDFNRKLIEAIKSMMKPM